MLNKSFSILNSSLNTHNIQCIEEYEEDIHIEGFQNQLVQAIINIVNNAKDALNDNRALQQKYIFVKTHKDSGTLILTIKDNAGGIDSSIIEKVFDPYFTTKHQSIGTGIGLSIAYQIITEHHHSNIEVFNETYEYLNKKYSGACFKITFKTA